MIYFTLMPEKDVQITRELAHALVYSSLPDQYHEQGIERQYGNRDAVRGHSLVVYSGKYPAGMPIPMEFRAVDAVEEKFRLPENPQINGVPLTVLSAIQVQPFPKLKLETLKPILVRIPVERPEAQKIIRPGQKTAYWTYEDDPEGWVTEVQSQLKYRGQALMGMEGEPRIHVIQAKTVRDRWEHYVVKGTMATLMFESGAWADLAYRIGLGDRCTYGFGTLR